MTLDLFGNEGTPETPSPDAPLPERLRPLTLAEIVGPADIYGPQGIVARLLGGRRLPHLIFWGPPGVGKTTLARAIARQRGAKFLSLTAIEAGVKELRAALADARSMRRAGEVVIFIDEIHHFNKTQQDVLLKDLETGPATLIGATTENPSFSLNGALLSRMHVIALPALDTGDLQMIFSRALSDPRGLNTPVSVNAELLAAIAQSCDGDARRGLMLLQLAVTEAEAEASETLTAGHLQHALRHLPLQYDRAGDKHYDTISAFIKSMRGSDPDAAVFWLAAMLEAGEDPLYIARRMIIFASEDIGNADPAALPLAVAAHEAFTRVGLAEGWIPLSHAAVYLACAPKSKATYEAYRRAKAVLRERKGTVDVPMHLRNAPTKLMKELGHGEGYRDPHAAEDGFDPVQTYLPAEAWVERARPFYRPTAHGKEEDIGKRLERQRSSRGSK